MELREGLEKIAGMSEDIAKRLLKDKRHSLTKGFFGGGALGTAAGTIAGGAAAPTVAQRLMQKFAPEALATDGSVAEVMAKDPSIGHMLRGIGGGAGAILGGTLGSAAGVARQHMRNKAAVKNLARKLRMGAGVGAGAGAVGLGGLAAYHKSKK